MLISVSPTAVQVDEDTRKVFAGWFYGNGTLASRSARFRIMAGQDLEIRAEWTTLYRVEVSSEYGAVRGGGWYREGETAVISIRPLVVQRGADIYEFRGWADESGSMVSQEAQFSYKVYGPASFTALWERRPGYLGILDLLASNPYLIIILALLAVIIALLARGRKR